MGIPSKEPAAMYPANAFSIRLATDRDAAALRDLAELDSRDAPTGRVIVAETAGAMVAAVSLDDGRTVADPFRPTNLALAQLRMRAEGRRAVERTPSLRERMLRAMPARA
jgi:hypothetical protein